MKHPVKMTSQDRFTNFLPAVQGGATFTCICILCILLHSTRTLAAPIPATSSHASSTLVQPPDSSIAQQQPKLIPRAQDVEYQKSLHLSASIASTVLLVFVQYHVSKHGYKLSRSWYRSTDHLIWLTLGVISLFWTILVVHSAAIWESYGSTPCRQNARGWECAGRLAFTPWVLDGVFCWWMIKLLSHRFRRWLWRQSSYHSLLFRRGC